MKIIQILSFCLLSAVGVFAQDTMAVQKQLIQFSGLVLDGTNEELLPVPYSNILVKDQGRGTYTDFSGFFSLVVRQGDVIEFSAIGYQTVQFTIPDTLADNRYSFVQLMTKDDINLPEAVVFPWPSREHFKLEFLALDVTSEMQQRALENVASENLARARSTVSVDGKESAGFYLRQQSKQYYHYGQAPPMNIFNPIAWKDFFDAWKNGDFKKKKQ